MQISGIIEKVYDYDFGTGDISMDILSDGKVIRCTGISGRFQAGHPVIIEGTLGNNTFMFHNINMDYSNAVALKKLVPNTQLPDIKDLDKIKNLDRKIISAVFMPQLEQDLYNEYRDDLSFTQIRSMVSRVFMKFLKIHILSVVYVGLSSQIRLLRKEECLSPIRLV